MELKSGPDTIGLRFGALAPPIGQQLVEQGFMANEKHSSTQWEEDARAIVRLYLRGLLTSSQKDAAQKKLFNKIKRGSFSLSKFRRCPRCRVLCRSTWVLFVHRWRRCQ